MNSDIEQMLLTGQYDIALERLKIRSGEDTLYYKARICEIKGLYYQGLQYIEEIEENADSDELKIVSILLKALLLERSGEFDKAYKLLEEAQTLNYSRSDISEVYKLFIDFIPSHLEGDMARENGENIKARELFNKSLDIAISQNNPFRIALSLRSLGTTFTGMGEIAEGLACYKKCEILAIKNNDLYNLGLVCNSLGIIYWNQRDYKTSLKYYNSGLSIWQKIGNNLEIAKAFMNIGSNYREMGDIKKSKAMLQESLVLQYRIGRKLDESFSLFELLIISVSENNLDDCSNIIKRLENLSNNSKNLYIHTHYKLAKAIKFKKFGSQSEKEQAKVLFEEVIYAEIIAFHLTMHALKLSCEMLLDELRLHPSDLVVSKLTDQLDMMENYSRKYHYHPHTVDALNLQSNLAILKGELDHARRLLLQAEEIAQQHNLPGMLLEIKLSKVSLDSEISKIMKIVKNNSTIGQRLKDEYMIELIDSLGLRLNPIPESQQLVEHPVLFFLVTKDGNIRLLYEFDRLMKSDPNLIASFIAAINSFLNQAFDLDSNIESIRHKDFTIALDSYQNFIFCYIYKGKSSMAEKNLRSIVDILIKDEEYYDILINHPNKMIDESDKLDLILLRFVP